MHKSPSIKTGNYYSTNRLSNLLSIYAIDIIAGLLILLFIYTAGSKLADFHDFKRQMFSQKFSKGIAEIIIYTLPETEIIVSILLIKNSTRLFGFICSSVLMLVFTIYMGLVYFGYYNTAPCACGGVFSTMKFEAHFYFNSFFLAIALLGTFLQYKLIKRGG